MTAAERETGVARCECGHRRAWHGSTGACLSCLDCDAYRPSVVAERETETSGGFARAYAVVAQVPNWENVVGARVTADDRLTAIRYQGQPWLAWPFTDVPDTVAERETGVADGAADPLADDVKVLRALVEAWGIYSDDRGFAASRIERVLAALDAERAETARLRERLADYEASDGSIIHGDLVARFRDIKARVAALETETPA